MAECGTPIRGRRFRLTRVDSCGRPVYGPASQIVTKGITTAEFGTEVEEGEDLTVKTADGELCLSEKGDDQIKWITSALNFCQVDPDVVTIINPSFPKIVDELGNVIGFYDNVALTTDTGFALEVWQDYRAPGSNACLNPNVTGQWYYHLIPWNTGSAPGEFTIENAATTIALNGVSKTGSLWGLGPYQIRRHPGTNALTGLPAPVPSYAPRGRMVVTVPPPEPMCGAQPLSNPAGPINAAVTEDETDNTRMTVEVVATSGRPMQVDWGDGDAPEPLVTATPLPHQYADEGRYVITVRFTDAAMEAVYRVVNVPFTS